MRTQIDRINKVAKMVGKRTAQGLSPDTVLLYKPNGDEAGEWTWEEVKNWAEGNIGANTYSDWMWKAEQAYDKSDGKTLGKMIYEFIYKNSKRITSQAGNGALFVFTVSPSNDPGAITGGDSVTVLVDSGNPGGDPGEFEEYMKKVLSDWFDAEVN